MGLQEGGFEVTVEIMPHSRRQMNRLVMLIASIEPGVSSSDQFSRAFDGIDDPASGTLGAEQAMLSDLLEAGLIVATRNESGGLRYENLSAEGRKISGLPPSS